MEHLHSNFFIETSINMELLAFNYFLNNRRSIGFSPELLRSSDFVSIDKDLDLDTGLLSNFFFHEQSYFGLTLVHRLFYSGKLNDFSELIKLIESMSFKELFLTFFKSGYDLSTKELNFNDPNNVFIYIENSILSSSEKHKLLYLYFLKDKTKESLVTLLTDTYEKYFKRISSYISLIHKDSKERICNLNKNEILFLLDNFQNPNCNKPSKVILIPSYFYYKSSLFSYDHEKDTAIYLIGTERLNEKREIVDVEENTLNMIKAISDRTKLKIIKTLYQNPSYGFELAKKLNLSSPTISHHLSKLEQLKIVSSSRHENKVYYNVNPDELQKAAELMSKMFKPD